jgi:hypothetical protein
MSASIDTILAIDLGRFAPTAADRTGGAADRMGGAGREPRRGRP